MISPPTIEVQRDFWNGWNANNREKRVSETSIRQRETVLAWLDALGNDDLDIIDIGCGTGWLCKSMTQFGRVTGTDLADEVLSRARVAAPEVQFIAGDFFDLALPEGEFDVVVSLEVLSHVADQSAFVRRTWDLLRPGGHLMLATQNRWVLERSNVAPPSPGQLRHWLYRHELRALVEPLFKIRVLSSLTPVGHGGILRLVNAPKLNLLLSPIIGARRLERAKEALGLGFTLVLLAQKPS